MTLTVRRPMLLWSAAVTIALLLLAIAALALTAGGGVSHRASVYGQLERPATFPATTVGPGPVRSTVQAGAYRVSIALSPNRARVRDHVAIALAQGGRPVNGARVSVTYSMPSMGMLNVFSGPLAQAAGGTYSAREPVFGMPGAWRLRFAVAPPGAAPFTVVINDRMIP
jgi:YtkA-like